MFVLGEGGGDGGRGFDGLAGCCRAADDDCVFVDDAFGAAAVGVADGPGEAVLEGGIAGSGRVVDTVAGRLGGGDLR